MRLRSRLAITAAINANLPANQVVSGVELSDPEDVPPAVGRNDFLYEATSLPYEGGNLTIQGSGRLGTLNGVNPPTNVDDVDLLRLNVRAGTVVAVDLDLLADDLAQTPLDSVIRFFDSEGNELSGLPNPAEDTVELTAPADGLIYIGFSGVGNGSYDPRIELSAQAGQMGTYDATISLTVPSVYQSDENVIEFAGGQQDITVSQPGLFSVIESSASDAIDVPVSRFMSAGEIAEQVQRAVANRFVGGDTSYLPTSGSSLRLPGFSIVDPGPFSSQDERHGEQFATGASQEP